MSEWGFVMAAYAVAWTVLGGYALYVRARIRRARAMLEGMGEGREVVR
ncbi:MAG TPA: CcmD family protein [Longimicrobiales bacterium]